MLSNGAHRGLMPSAMGVLLVVSLCCVSIVFGQEQWGKEHLRLTDPGDGSFIAELSIISNTATPYRTRILLEDSAHRHVVLRNLVDGQTFSESFELQETGEVLSIQSDDSTPALITVTYESSSFTFVDGEEGAATTQQEASGLFGQMSTAMQEAVKTFARLGALYVSDLEGLTSAYEDLFFADDPSLDGERLVVRAERDAVAPFDPTETPPSVFEEAFGDAYFE